MYIPSFLTLTLPLLKSRQSFQAYDSCASSCFDQYLPIWGSQCTETVDTQPWIACVCQDTFFSVESAVCIYTSCGATILNSTAQKHESNCNANGSPPAVDAQDFVTYGKGGTPEISGTSIILPTATATAYSFSIPSETAYSLPTSTSTSTGSGSGSGSSNNTPTTTKSSAQDSATQTSSSPATSSSAASNGGSNTLSTAALVGTIVGSVTGAIGSFAGVYFAYKSYKLKKEEKKKEASEDQSNVVGT